MRVVPILVRPLYAGNLGAVVRVAANFMLPEVVLVDPRCRLGTLEFRRMAMGGQDHVTLTVLDTLAEAARGADLVVTTTSGRDRDPRQLLRPDEVRERLLAPGVSRVALVFGSERSGLTQRELRSGHVLMTIPTNPAFPTLNLVQSVAIALASLAGGDIQAPAPTDPADGPAGADDLAAALEHFERVLLESGFLDRQNPARVMDQIRRWLGRAVPTQREAAILRALASHVTYLHQRQGPPAG